MPFGPPRVGKTCLLQRLLDEDLPGTPTTNTTAGSGSESTDVLSESKMIQIELKMDDDCGSAVPIVVEEGGKWSVVKSLEDEIALYMKSIQHQTEHNQSSKLVESSKSDEFQSGAAVNDQSNTKDTTTTEATGDYETSSSKHVSPTLLDDAVINAITRHVEGKNVDLSRIQVLLNKSITIFFTDTGGQPEFQEVLPALAAGPNLFLLVFDLHQSLDSSYKVLYESSLNKYELYDSSFTVREVLMQCLSSISSYHIGQSRDFSLTQMMKCSAPPTSVVSIATHCDLVNKDVYKQVDQDLKESIKESTLDKNEIIEPFTEDELVIPVDNYNPEDGAKVRKVIERTIKRPIKGVSPYKIELPAHWLGFQLYLRQKGSSTITYSECLIISEKLGIPNEDLKSCLWYLHYKTGTIRYYHNVEKLKDTVIIQPKILFAAVTKFIMSTFSLANVPQNVRKKFKTLGLFNSDEVRDVFDHHKDKLEISFDQFTAFLQHLNILVLAHDENYDYFLPCALVHASVSNPIQYVAIVISSLFILFEGGFVPKGIFSGLLGSLIKRAWSIAYDHHHTPRLFRNKAILSFDLKESDDSIDCVIAASANFVEISLENCDDEQSQQVAYPHTQEVISESMIDACSRLNYGRNCWKFGVVCCHRICTNTRQHFAEFDLKTGRLQCQMTMKRYGLTKQYMLWFKGNDELSFNNYQCYSTKVILLHHDNFNSFLDFKESLYVETHLPASPPSVEKNG